MAVSWCVLQDEAQLIAADELCARGWWWHKKFRCWFIHAPNNPVVKNATARSERGTYLFFDTSIWDVVQVRRYGCRSFSPYRYLCCVCLLVTLCVPFKAIKQQHCAAGSLAVSVLFGFVK
jgi:hypothetical protein